MRSVAAATGQQVPHVPQVRDQANIVRTDLEWDSYLPPRASGRSWRVQQRIKRAIDIAGALGALVILSPLLLVVGLLVRLSSRGPVLYRYPVVGFRGRPFTGLKFRTMVMDADARKAEYLEHNEMTGPVFKLRNDPRVTSLGRFLRKYSIDELPQLWLVVRGEMSLVGPRAPGPDEFARFERWQCGKLAVKPGITCIWQVSGRSEISDFDTWARLDLEYIESWNLARDFILLLRTVPAVISARGAY
jgi:lipopolysaccharide/colanic/teichoic acid biosynthesis glycosyltransferase